MVVMKKGVGAPKFNIVLNTHPVGVERVGKSITIATMDKRLRTYTNKCKLSWNIDMPTNITCITSMDYKAKTFKG